MDRFLLHTDTKIFLEKLMGQLTAPIAAVADAWNKTSAEISDGFANQQKQIDALTAAAQENAIKIQSLTDQLAAAPAGSGETTPDPADVAALADLAGKIGGFAVPTPPAS